MITRISLPSVGDPGPTGPLVLVLRIVLAPTVCSGARGPPTAAALARSWSVGIPPGGMPVSWASMARSGIFSMVVCNLACSRQAMGRGTAAIGGMEHNDERENMRPANHGGPCRFSLSIVAITS
jgi:hypothetical protein